MCVSHYRASPSALEGHVPSVPADSGTPGFLLFPCQDLVSVFVTISLPQCVAGWSTEMHRENLHLSCASWLILWEKDQSQNVEGRKQIVWSILCHQSNCCTWSFYPNYTLVLSLREISFDLLSYNYMRVYVYAWCMCVCVGAVMYGGHSSITFPFHFKTSLSVSPESLIWLDWLTISPKDPLVSPAVGL